MPDTKIEQGKVLLRRSPDERKPLVQRLNRIEGQVRGVRLMIEEDRHCSEELLQIKAAISALREVALAIVEQHVSAAAALAVANEGERDIARDDLMRVLRESARF